MKFWLKPFDTFRQNFRKTSFPTKKEKKNPNNFFHKIFLNFLYPLKIGKHIEVENQLLCKLRKSWVVFRWYSLPSGLYNLISFPVRNIIRRPWSLPTQLIPEISLSPLRWAESSLNFCIRCGKSGIDFNQFHYSLKSMFKMNDITFHFWIWSSPNLKIFNSSVL